MRCVPVAAVAVMMMLAGCGSGGGDGGSAQPEIIEQGQETLGEDVVRGPGSTVAAVDPGSGGAAEGDGPGPVAGSTTSTLPQNEVSVEERVDDLFTAMRVFNTCLEDEGRPFIGFDASAPADDPRNDPAYLEALGKCAALSRIQDALAEVDLGSEGKTPEEIEEQNRGLVRFADCLKGRGWDPAPLVPDDNGLLQVGDLGPPEGESILDSDDMGECRRIAGQDDEG